jgi:hypothetical protein
MSHNLPFQLQNFDAYLNELQRVGIEPGYVMYTNHHASNGQAATRLVSSDQIEAAETYINSPSDQTFIRLVALGVLFDTEWDRNTQHWELISFHGWEKLHNAFSHLLAKADKTLIELVGLSSLELTEIASNGY